MTLALTPDQIARFERDGVLVIDDVLPVEILNNVKAEYEALLDTLYAEWHSQGRVPPGDNMDFFQKLLVAYEAGCEWFQPMDISLPGSEIAADTPFHI